MTVVSTEHPFAQYVRTLGRGKNTARSLTREEAFAAFTHILNEEVEDIQLGAFLLLLRVKGEDENEMAGFAEAAQQFIQAPSITVDIDWPSYAGKHKQQPWYLLAALLLAARAALVVALLLAAFWLAMIAALVAALLVADAAFNFRRSSKRSVGLIKSP